MKKTRKKVRQPLTPEKVLSAALQLADEKGLEALSMRNLAQVLKVEAMSLYNHVASKEELLSGLVEMVAGEIDVPVVGGNWKEELRRRAHSAHRVLTKHPWATMLFVSRLNIGPNMLRYVDATIACLHAEGFSFPQADHVWNTLDAFIYGFTLQKRNFPLVPGEYASAAKQFIHLIPPEQFPGLNGMSQEVIAGRHDGIQHLEFGLELLLEGFERLHQNFPA
ncbi:MAG: TetR/AcrR family transcriptional regulator [Archangium sp.]|nr:TetR/AcrR family transcriptional regulator [Archangium sp.]MDP3154737.1 TetR/AcrR family transcriptional regulator [Archangium sp.]MDP3573627.1 TetR/AcrR family transcriptional regulator [Archangium sp.]